MKLRQGSWQKKHRPHGLKENKEIARCGGSIAKNTRDNLENELGESVITDKNALNYKYIDETKQIDDNEYKPST